MVFFGGGKKVQESSELFRFSWLYFKVTLTKDRLKKEEGKKLLMAYLAEQLVPPAVVLHHPFIRFLLTAAHS